MIEDYFNKIDIVQQKHGDKSIVLIQNGAFYEMYGLYDEQQDLFVGSKLQDVCNACNLHIANKHATVRGKPVYQAGFGMQEHTLDKYLKRILNEGYAVEIWTQDEQVSGTSRSLKGTYTAGTYFYNDENNISNNTTCVWLQKHKNNIVIGVSNIDIHCGRSTMYEYSMPYNNSPISFNEFDNLLLLYKPTELLCVHNLNCNEFDQFCEYISVSQNIIKSIHIDDSVNECPDKHKMVKNSEKQVFQLDLFLKIFETPLCTLSPNIQSHEIALSSYCYLVQHICIYNPNLIKKIHLPIFETHLNKLILENHSLIQLDITGPKSLEQFLNKCKTASGKRQFLYNLSNPQICPLKLNNLYDITKHLVNTYKDFSLFRNKLSCLRDIEKKSRKIVLKILTPHEMWILYNDLLEIRDLIKLIQNDQILDTYMNNSKTVSQNCELLIKYIEQRFLLDQCKCVYGANKFTDNFLKCGVYQEHDTIVEYFSNSNIILQSIQQLLHDLISKYEKNTKTLSVKLTESEKEGPSLILTSRRSVLLQDAIKKISNKHVNSYYFSQTSNSTEHITLDMSLLKFESADKNDTKKRIVSPQLADIYYKIKMSKKNLTESLVDVHYNYILPEMENFYTALIEISDYICRFDLTINNAYVSKKYNYSCPRITNSYDAHSFFVAKGLKHPLVELTLKNELYVTNDISLTPESNGMLLYGTNAVGKSCLMKSIGICIIMAQLGFFVPASEFVYYPYKCIFTRIQSNDNLWKGLSKFDVEMLEFKNILETSNRNSLILGDELCSSTESGSAHAIFALGVSELSSQKTNFIFATHFHEITEYDEIQELKSLQIKHMEVEYNHELDVLIYHRKLKDGPGLSLYGLEVCKALHFPNNFVNRAYEIRNKYCEKLRQNNVLGSKVSHFNSSKVIGTCEICGNKMGEEVHHLQHQKNANISGFIGSTHKNHPGNLINVCSKCHDHLHESDQEHIKVSTNLKTQVLIPKK